MIGATKEGIQESQYANYLNMPYIGPAVVSNYELTEIAGQDNVFSVEFELQGSDIKDQNVEGFIHSRLEFEPEGDEKLQKAVDRIAYFAKKFAAEEDVMAIKGQNWRDYCSKMIQLLNAHNVKGAEATIKVIGNVYNGKARVQSPKYPGWISTDGKPLVFSKKEMEANAEYLAALTAAPTPTEESAVSVDLVDEAGF